MFSPLYTNEPFCYPLSVLIGRLLKVLWKTKFDLAQKNVGNGVLKISRERVRRSVFYSFAGMSHN